MGMKGEILPPCMDDLDDAGLSAKIPMIASQSQQRLRCRTVKQRVKQLLIGKEERIEIMGHGEDDVKILRIEDLRATLIDPELFQDRLTIWTMPVTAGSVVDPNVATFIADAGVETEPSGLAVADRQSSPALLWGNRMLPEEVPQRVAEDFADGIGLTHRTPAESR